MTNQLLLHPPLLTPSIQCVPPSPVIPPIGPRTHSYLLPNVITLATVGGKDAISALNEPVAVWSLRTSRDLPVPVPIASLFLAIHVADISLGVFQTNCCNNSVVAKRKLFNNFRIILIDFGHRPPQNSTKLFFWIVSSNIQRRYGTDCLEFMGELLPNSKTDPQLHSS